MRLIIVLVVATIAGCAAGTGMTPSASVTTAVQGWEHYFRLDWSPKATRAGTEIEGYLYNNYGRPMGGVRVLGQALDAQGTVLAQKIEWVPGIVPALDRSYFRISALPTAPQYRVSVWAFDIIDSGDFPHRRF
jgi:hypothetical protein